MSTDLDLTSHLLEDSVIGLQEFNAMRRLENYVRLVRRAHYSFCVSFDLALVPSLFVFHFFQFKFAKLWQRKTQLRRIQTTLQSQAAAEAAALAAAQVSSSQSAPLPMDPPLSVGSSVGENERKRIRFSEN